MLPAASGAGSIAAVERAHVRAASLHYLSVESMQEGTQLPEDAVFRACFTRGYPTRVPAKVEKLRFETARA